MYYYYTHLKTNLYFGQFNNRCVVTMCRVFLGELMTTAGYLRKCVHDHKDYKKDSVVSDKIAYDLLLHLKEVSESKVSCPELTGTLVSKTPQSYKVVDCPPSEEQTTNK